MNAPPKAAADTAAVYAAALRDCVLAVPWDADRLFFTGKDALDLLHRLTTQDVRSLQPGTGSAAVFVTAKGRILDLVTLHRLEDRLLCLTSPGRAQAVAAYVERYTFGEEVRIQQGGESHALLGLFGARAGERVADLFGAQASGRPLHHPIAVTLSGAPGILLRTFPLGGDSYLVFADAPDLPLLKQGILERIPGLPAADPVSLELLRIESGLPGPGRELTEDHNPWEACLDDAISLNKGCYVGQEVIARLNPYDKVARRLVRLRLDGDVPQPGARLESQGGEPVGTLTSAAAAPGGSRVAALGYVRNEALIEGATLAVIDGTRRLQATLLGGAR